LLAVITVGKLTRQSIQNWDRYTLAFTEIDCTPPPTQERAEFLGEVQQLAGLPERLSVLDPDLASRLAEALACHPYVEKVEQVVILPSRAVRVQLAYRVPVLEVMLPEPVPKELSHPETGTEPSWWVDGRGVILPRKTAREPLPLLFATTKPAGSVGQVWGDTVVEGAARTAAYLRPYQDRLHLRVFETSSGILVLCTLAGTRVLWGQAPGGEAAGEVPAAQKLERLLQYCATHGGLDWPAGRYEHEVRLPQEASHRPLPKVE
jgi:hypothetical protein